METTAIRRQLHNYLEVADDKKIKAIYTIMETDLSNTLPPYSEELKTELKQRAADYKSGKSEVVTAEESKQRIQAILNGVKKWPIGMCCLMLLKKTMKNLSCSTLKEATRLLKIL